MTLPLSASRLPATALALLVAGYSGASDKSPHSHDHASHGSDDIGVVDFRADCSEEVLEDFNRALGLKHHMMYQQARREFARIKEQDPSCAMARWGVAATLFQPLWGTRPSEDDLQRGRDNAQEAMALASTAREKALIGATEAFFAETDAGFWDRLHGWIDGMDAAYQAFPEDTDIATLHSLALLTRAQQADDPDRLHDQAEAILRDAWEDQPAHPGAIHYSIHATDADGRERNALDMVKAYADIAPGTPHALHMPSHIYVRLGDWPSVIEWNERSAQAALDNPVNDSISLHYIHAMDYMLYAHLQRGEDDKADDRYQEAFSKSPHQASFVSAYHMAAMPARLAVERRNWDEASQLPVRSPDYLPWDQSHWPEAMTWHARGLGAVHSGDTDEAKKARSRLETLADEARAAGEARMATYIDANRKVLSGWIALAENAPRQALAFMNEATELEASVEKHPVEPGSLQPTHEALGDLLLALERPDDALEAYAASDAVWPGRYNTLLGAARAARQTGDTDTAGEYYQQLLAITGESSREGVAEAGEFLQGAQASR